MRMIDHVFEPGFFASGPVHTALILVSAVAALVAGPLGVFTVLRGQSFAGEALGDIGTTGGSGAYLVGVGPLWGFLVFNVAAVALMELIGVQRRRGRDLATGDRARRARSGWRRCSCTSTRPTRARPARP